MKKSEERVFIKVSRSARSKFCDLQDAHYVRCYIIEQYSVKEDIELCTMFCSDELGPEDFSDESAEDNSLPVTTTLRGNIIVTSHLRSLVDDNKLLLDIQKLYGTYFFEDAVHLLKRRISMGTPWHLPCNQLYLLRKTHELQIML